MSTSAVHHKHGGSKQLFAESEDEQEGFLDPLKEWLGCGEHGGGGGGGGGSGGGDGGRSLEVCSGSGGSSDDASSPFWVGLRPLDACDSDVLTKEKQKHLVAGGGCWEARSVLGRKDFIMGCLESIVLADDGSSPRTGQSSETSSEDHRLLHWRFEDEDRRTTQASPSSADRPSPASADSVQTYQGHTSQPTSLERLEEVGEPLFWPFDDESYSLLDIDGDVFCASPPKSVVSHASRLGLCEVENREQWRRQEQGDQGAILIGRSASVTEEPTRDHSKPHTPTTTTTTGCRRSKQQVCKQNSRVCSDRKAAKGRPECSFPAPTYVELTECALLATNATLMESLIGLGEFDGTEGVASCDLETNWLSDAC